MSKRMLNQFFVPVYRDLMLIPEYTKHFQSKAVGSFHMILKAHVWRRGYHWTKSEGYYGPFLNCAKEYDNGKLVAHMKDEVLADLLGVGQRHIRRLRSQLKDLGLIDYKKESYKSTAYYYVVGEVLRPSDYGGANEVFFDEKWLKQIEDQKNTYGEVLPDELDFVSLLRNVLNYVQEDNGNSNGDDSSDTILAIHSQDCGHTEPESEILDVEETTTETIKIEADETPYKDNRIKGTINSSTVTVQDGLFESEIDLGYIKSTMSSAELGRALIREHNRVGDNNLRAYLENLTTQEGIHLDPYKKESMYYSSFVDGWFKAFPPSGKMSTAIGTWWKALSIDLGRSDLLKDPKKNTIILSKIEGVRNWFEFSFLVKELFNNNGGFKFFQGFKHITWLKTSLDKEVYKLQEFRNAVDVTQLKNVKKIDIDEVQRELDRRLDEAVKQQNSSDGEEYNDIDIDDLLSLD